MRNRTNRLDRILLVLLGAVVLLAGAGGVLLRLGVFGASWKHRPIIEQNTTDFFNRHESWLWWAIGGGALVIAVLAIYWLIVQLRTERIGNVDLGPAVDGENTLASSALADAVRREAENVEGVARARARLVHESAQPQLRLAVALREDADLGAVQRALDTDVLAHAREAIGRETLPTWLRVEVDATEAPRVL
ncbi:MAG: hypothetical protein ACR2F6_19425 [Mycobacteriales bacterium]